MVFILNLESKVIPSVATYKIRVQDKHFVGQNACSLDKSIAIVGSSFLLSVIAFAKNNFHPVATMVILKDLKNSGKEFYLQHSK
ncbi:MAG: hypothetical protein FWE18_03555 [Alphaproteobacteria bacterium]|nr:hypothetical protein [Alphaproteobacteria bacterium]